MRVAFRGAAHIVMQEAATVAPDDFTILGLAPGHYDEAEITRRFQKARARVLSDLARPETRPAAERRLDELHVAYAALRHAAADRGPRADASSSDATARMRRLIAASLEGGLLRYSQRQRILEAGRELGFNDFQTQLLIAQVQFGDERIQPVRGTPVRPRALDRRVALANAAAILLLAGGMFLLALNWLAGGRP